MDAKAFPPSKSPLRLDLPTLDPELQLPPVASGPVRHYGRAPANADPGDAAARWLVTPPPIQAGWTPQHR